MTAYKILRWPMLVVLCAVLVLFFKRPERLSPNPQSPAAIAKNANAFQDKLGELQEAHQRGDGGVEVRLTSEEVGAAFMVANPQPSAQVTSGATVVTPASTDSGSSATVTPEQVGVKDPQVIFDGDEVKGQFAANVYGKGVFVTLSGHLGAKDGYATFAPSSFKIGSMPVPIAMVQAQLDRKLSVSEAREKLRLPE